MTKYARVEEGTVTEIVSVDAGSPPLETRYHASMLSHFVPLTGQAERSVQPGWHYDGMGFSQPAQPAPPPPSIRYVAVATVRERMEAINKWDELVYILQQDMPTMMKVLTLRDGIDPADPQARTLIAAAGADPDDILAI